MDKAAAPPAAGNFLSARGCRLEAAVAKYLPREHTRKAAEGLGHRGRGEGVMAEIFDRFRCAVRELRRRSTGYVQTQMHADLKLI